MGALTSPSKSGLSGGGQRGGQGHVGEGSVRPTRCELPPLLGVTLQPLRPSGLGTISLGRGPRGGERGSSPFQNPPTAHYLAPQCVANLRRALLARSAGFWPNLWHQAGLADLISSHHELELMRIGPWGVVQL